MRRVIRRALGGAIAILALIPACATGTAVPEGPRLAFLRFTERPDALIVGTSDPALREPAMVAGGGRKIRPLPHPFSSPSWSPDGSLIAFSGMTGSVSRLLLPKSRKIFIVATDGSGIHAIPGTQGGFAPVFSPDGKMIAFAKTLNRSVKRHPPFGPTVWKGTTVWTVDLDGGSLRQLTSWENGVEGIPSSFSPDGKVLGLTHRDVFHDRADATALRLDGNGSYVLAEDAAWPRYSPDGSRIAYLGIRRGHGTTCCELGDGFSVDLYAMNADRSFPRRLTDTPAKAERPASWDPSGERFAYTTKRAPTENTSGDLEASVMQINADGTCLSRLSVPVPRVRGYHVSFRFPTWQPGLGREAGRIDC